MIGDKWKEAANRERKEMRHENKKMQKNLVVSKIVPSFAPRTMDDFHF